MDFRHYLVVLSALISVIGASFYLKDTISGKTKPNRVSWFLWAAAPLIGGAAAIAGGADFWANSRILIAGILPLLIFLATFFNKQAYWAIGRFDLICGSLSLIAFIFWFFVDSPTLGVLLAAIGDGMASIPTIRKAYNYPKTETAFTYLMSLLSLLVILPAITEWNIVSSSFHIQLVLQNLLIVSAIFRKQIAKIFTNLPR